MSINGAIRMVERMVRTAKKEWDEDLLGDFDEGSATMDMLPAIMTEGLTAQQAREVAVRMVGFVPAELALAYGMRPSDDDDQEVF